MAKINWRSFEEARAFVHELKLKNSKEWINWAKSEAKPDDIPSCPYNEYKDKGWKGFGDWLGTGAIANQNRSYKSFEEARSFVHQLQLKNKEEWQDWVKRGAKPENIPSIPRAVYKGKGWKGFGDWLGTNTIANQNRNYRSFREARSFVHQLQIKSSKEWMDWAKNGEKPDDIPANPALVYKDNGWLGWGDWLGTDIIANQNRIYRSFEDARIFSRSLGLKNQNEWQNWVKTGAKPDDVPADSSKTYKDDGWLGWGDWLGIINSWRPNAILSFLYSLKPILSSLEPSELYAIMRQNGMIISLGSKQKNAEILKKIKDLASNEDQDKEVKLNEIVVLVAIYADFTAFFLVNDAVGIDFLDNISPSPNGAIKSNDDREFSVNNSTGKNC